MRTEFEFIHYIKKKYGLGRVGDDCAVLPKDDKTDLVITADMLVEEIDFRLDWTTPEFLGHKALAVSLSDIAAMGATPKWAMLSFGIPKVFWVGDLLDSFYNGWHKLAGEFGVELVGGDISKISDKFVIDSIVLGEVPKGQAISRSGAKPGDAIYVTGTLGAASAGLKLLEDGVRFSESSEYDHAELLLAQLRPQPRVAEGIRIREQIIPSAMIDISDGLSSDLAHICETSKVGAIVYADKIPIARKLSGLYKSFDARLELALHGGEDFELLFTANKEKISPDKLAGFTCIGEVTANIGVIELSNDGKTKALDLKGYRHF